MCAAATNNSLSAEQGAKLIVNHSAAAEELN
jgi:hypothetical protein